MRCHLILLGLILFGLAGCGGGVTIDEPAEHRILFLGNSFTANNELDQLVSKLLSRADDEWGDHFTMRYAKGGYTLQDHSQDIDIEDNQALSRRALVAGNDTVRDWDLVVLQEQSQILGFAYGNGEKVLSLDSASRINLAINETDATAMIMMTWGYAFGDDLNPSVYPDYLTMQRQLVLGTKDLENRLSTMGRRVYMIPAGWGFELVYRDVEAIGLDPLAEGSRFRALYASDHKHPSLAGSYLVACVITAVYTGQPVSDINWRPRGVDADFAQYLRDVADRVVFGDEFPDIDYPWE
ncbi:MAG: hypothetical protein AAF490_22735 [Chloroflexota bacterium]